MTIFVEHFVYLLVK